MEEFQVLFFLIDLLIKSLLGSARFIFVSAVAKGEKINERSELIEQSRSVRRLTTSLVIVKCRTLKKLFEGSNLIFF